MACSRTALLRGPVEIPVSRLRHTGNGKNAVAASAGEIVDHGHSTAWGHLENCAAGSLGISAKLSRSVQIAVACLDERAARLLWAANKLPVALTLKIVPSPHVLGQPAPNVVP